MFIYRASQYVIDIELSYEDYCALDNELTNTLLAGPSSRLESFDNDTITIAYFDDTSGIWFDDRDHTILVFYASIDQPHVKFIRLPR